MSDNANSPAAPIKLNERIESATTGDITINECDNYFAGLTKREYFTAAALQGLCARSTQSLTMRQRAAKAVEYADLALRELGT